ncbi:putative Cupin type-2 domain-containing protein [Seiridium unicorne]|uniref:Cupin type-2 domain-containing protein n=1 Tax=Seiridium unicorne TaxID=138068 RepID=A0ABR2V9C6_9PEZI
MLRNPNGRAAEIVIYLTSDAFSSGIKHPSIPLEEVGTMVQNFHEFALVLFRERRPAEDGTLTAEGRCLSNVELAIGALEHLVRGVGDIEVVYPIVWKWFTPRRDDISVLPDLSDISWEKCCLKVGVKVDELTRSNDPMDQSLAYEAIDTLTMFEQERPETGTFRNDANILPNVQGFWPGTPTHHFHPNTHECYGVVSGTTTMLLGRGQLDPPASDQGVEYGRLVPLAPGDVIVIPAGTSHMNVEMTEDYRFVGVYPLGSPKWRSERCDNLDIMSQLRDEISGVPIPAADPVQGEGGILINLWSSTTAVFFGNVLFKDVLDLYL